jgi:uncharacterized protein
MQNNPLALVALIAVSAYVIKLWFDDFRLQRAGSPNPRALPGATAAPTPAILIGAVGGLVIVLAETIGEAKLGLSEQQSNITVLFAAYTLLAAFVEEIIFRGFIVVENRGPFLRWGAVFAASILFAALHPFLWEWSEGALTWHFGAKGWFSTVAVFTASLWFYIVRFAKFNPSHSLLPCFAAHLAKNVGVIAIKAVQGHVVGLY